MTWLTHGSRPDGRTLLVLARLPNLPTVWSNCIAAWLLSDGGEIRPLLWAGAGASFLCVAGAFLDAFFDQDLDRQHRKDRPTPSGLTIPTSVLRFGIAGLVIGTFVLLVPAGANPVFTLLLAVGIGAYSAIHKVTSLSPVLLGACRFLLYLVAGSTAAAGVAGFAMWCGLALWAYVVGLGCLARKQFVHSPVRRWLLAPLATPIALALIANAQEFRLTAAWLSLLLVVWLLPCLRYTVRENEPNLRFTVSGLLAGIVLVDLLAVAGHSAAVMLLFLGLFAATVVGQRFLPASPG